ncbi:MdtA/MuxA family multidrug efflux RND transporter periplasmic adaptor subunit [Marinomonas spartinae]|uniref:MdtA/MuxA family multidrug efflux RND transporter periplasmic adaptor subunit n=1 Tax=Marinomonas spartinae TaxID=1792290 RepID=UPI0018F1476D|nr:MdtA/MuxA family multidrug efflux RND transporter periplasmic adaptor subunit [Marinomonas spartinae]MBJ7554862.1 MdtA/MuxA family multidrug efflux RND transporter periplasmic adaptor subunit [Marinomonas spartinae]
MTTRSSIKFRLLLTLLIAIVVAGGWYGWHYLQTPDKKTSQSDSHEGGSGKKAGKAGHHFGGNRTTPVYAGVAKQADVAVYLNALGTVKANASVTVTSRVTGELKKVYFQEGQYVKQGELIAQIDDRSYQATLAQNEGALAQNEALLHNAKTTLARYQKLAKENSISVQDVQEQMATVGQYEGIVATAKAQIISAKLNIAYAKIKAPISGYIGLLEVDQGNLISSDSTAITTITQTNPITATFSIPQQHLQEVLQGLRRHQEFPVTLFDQTGAKTLATGKLTNISNSIDSDTGTIKLKALFSNDNEALYPNQFVNVRLQVKELKHAIVIPKAALQLNDNGDFVFVIGPDNKVKKHMVEAGPVDGVDWVVILSGVQAGDKLVTTGIDNLSDGSTVKIIASSKDVQ